MQLTLYITAVTLCFCVTIKAQDELRCGSAGCHQDLTTLKFIHPAAEDDCMNCHDLETDNHPTGKNTDFLLSDESPQLCFTCHDDKIPEDHHKSIHPPFEEDCLNCHNPHSSENKFMLEEKLPDLCLTCHDDPSEIENVKTVHGAIQIDDKCVNCHTPHSSENNTLLKKEEPSICLSCHNKEIKTEKRIIPNIAEKIVNQDLAHPPVVDDGCITCHHPHSSENNYLLDDTFPAGNYADGFEGNYGLCFSCHDETMITTEKTTSETNFRNGERNLHFLHIDKEKSRSCTNCHDVHGSKNEHLITGENKFGNWKMKIEYNVTENGGSCLPGCHERKTYQR